MVLLGKVGVVFEVNFWVCGVSTMWRAFRRAGWSVGRERGVRLMRIAGIRGVAEAGPLRPPGGAKTRVGAQTISHARSRPIGRTACGSPTSPASARSPSCVRRSDSSTPRSSPMPFPHDRGPLHHSDRATEFRTTPVTRPPCNHLHPRCRYAAGIYCNNVTVKS